MALAEKFKISKSVRDFSYWAMIVFLVILELQIIFLMFLIFWPVPIQKVNKVWSDLTCSYGVKQYSYSLATAEMYPSDSQIVFYDIDKLNAKIGFPLFVYNPNSPNQILLVNKMHQDYSVLSFLGMKETIGLTYCTAPCCGIDKYKVEFAEKELFYGSLKTRILIWHELGHVVGLNHDDSQPDIMNSIILSDGKFTQDVEDRFISKLKERMGIK